MTYEVVQNLLRAILSHSTSILISRAVRDGCFYDYFWVIEVRGGTWFRTPCPNCRAEPFKVSAAAPRHPTSGGLMTQKASPAGRIVLLHLHRKQLQYDERGAESVGLRSSGCRTMFYGCSLVLVCFTCPAMFYGCMDREKCFYASTL